MVELERRRLRLEASVVRSRFWLRAALLVCKPKPFGMMSDSWSHVALPLVLIPAVTTDAAAVVSEMVTLMALGPETTECESQTLEGSFGEVGEAASMVTWADPSSFCALLVIGEEMDWISGLGSFLTLRWGRGNLSRVLPPIFDFDQRPRIINKFG